MSLMQRLVPPAPWHTGLDRIRRVARHSALMGRKGIERGDQSGGGEASARNGADDIISSTNDLSSDFPAGRGEATMSQAGPRLL